MSFNDDGKFNFEHYRSKPEHSANAEEIPSESSSPPLHPPLPIADLTESDLKKRDSDSEASEVPSAEVPPSALDPRQAEYENLLASLTKGEWDEDFRGTHDSKPKGMLESFQP